MSAPAVSQPLVAARAPRAADTVVRILAGVIILLLWEGVVRLFAPPFVAKPSSIAAVFPAVITNPQFWLMAGSTLSAVFEGLAIGFVAGTLIGVAIGRIRLLDRLSSIYISGFFAMPMVAILPLVSLWFGYTTAARLATVVFATFFSIVVNVADGARAVPIEFIEVSRAYRGSALSRLFDVILPASCPMFSPDCGSPPAAR